MQAQEPRQPVFPLEREGREELMFQLKGSQAGGVLSYLGSGVWGQLGVRLLFFSDLQLIG